MSGIGEEASGIGQHSYETGQIAQVCQRDQLFRHPDLVIVKPPCAALLYLGHCSRILEAAQDGTDCLVVVGIEAVEDRSGKLVGGGKGV